MKYSNTLKAVFLGRPNRFIGKVLINNTETTVHIPNTGRCKELLIPGCTVYLTKSDNPNRKTQYDLIAVEKTNKTGTRLFNIDSLAPNHVAKELIEDNVLFNVKAIKQEYSLGDSRFDFWALDEENRIHLIEVKGCTLESGDIGLFPDAPTLRGLKHIKELINLSEREYCCHIVFILAFENAGGFSPNKSAQPEFCSALSTAKQKGVFIHAFDCSITPDSLSYKSEVPVALI